MSRQPNGTELSAGWAVWSKRPGSSTEYGILDYSEKPGLHDYQYDQIVRYFSVGTPPSGRDLSGSLPWVTISTMTINGQRYVGMAIKEPTADVDAAGRSITRTRFFCVPYRPFADGRVGYCSLYRGLAASQLPVPDRHQVRLNVPALDPEALAEEIVTELGEAAVTLAAALMLRGAVTVVGADDAAIDQRLRFIDAVTALLPYGFRAAGTAATWSDSVAPDTIRLAFAAWPREGTGAVGWLAAQPPPTGDNVTARYYQELRRLRDDQPGTGRLANIIEFLARDATPCDFEKADLAVESLRDFDLPFTVLADVRQDRVHLARVRRVFLTKRITELPSADREDLLAALIARGEPADLPLAADWWQQAATGNADHALSALVMRAGDFLWRAASGQTRDEGVVRPKRFRRLVAGHGPDEEAVRVYLEFASAHGLADGLLARLMVPPANGLDPAAGQAALVRLIVGWLLAGHDPAPLTQTRTALADKPALACAVLAGLAGAERVAVKALDWMRPASGALVDPFAVALISGPLAVTGDQVSMLTRDDPACVRLLVDTASTTGRLDWVLPGFAEWFAASARPPLAAGARSWRIAADVIGSLHSDDASVQAWIDLMLLTDVVEPRYLLVPQRDVGRYCAVFATGWNRLAGLRSDYNIDVRLEYSLANYLSGRPWIDDEVQAATVARIVDLLTADDRRPWLRDRIADTVPGPVDKALGAVRSAAKWLRGDSRR